MVPPIAMAERPREQTRTDLSDRLTAAHPTEEMIRITASIYTMKGDDLIKKHGEEIGECFAHIERCRPCSNRYQTYMNGSRSISRDYNK